MIELHNYTQLQANYSMQLVMRKLQMRNAQLNIMNPDRIHETKKFLADDERQSEAWKR